MTTSALDTHKPPTWWVYAIPAVAACLVFVQILSAGWVYDDVELFEINRKMRDWSTMWRTFTQPFWQITAVSEIHTGYYRPVGGAMFVLLYKIGGGTPFVYHFASWVFHALTSVLVARLAMQIGLGRFCAVLAGGYFAIYGGHVEAVAWASSLPDVLAAFFSLLALSSFLKGKLVLPAIWLALAMTSKESAFATWLLMIGMTIWAAPRLPNMLPGLADDFAFKRLPRLGMLLLVAIVVYLARWNAFGGPGAGFDVQTTYHALSPLHEAMLSMKLIAQYLLYFLWPLPNFPFQPLAVDVLTDNPALYLPALTGLVVLAAAAATWFWRSPRSLLILLGMGVLFAGLAPVLNTKVIGRFPFEQRFLYLPSIGSALLIGFAVVRMGSKFGRNALIGGVVVIAGINIYSAASAIPHWKDETSFFTWTRTQSPNAMTPYLNLARVYLQEAEQFPPGHPKRIEWAEKAFTEYENSLKVDSDKWLVVAHERENGNVGMGNALFIAGDVPTAEAIYIETLKGYPRSIYAHLGLAQCLLFKAERQAMMKSYDEVVPLWESALEHATKATQGIRPLADAHHCISVALYMLGRPLEALPPAEESLRLQPDYYAYVTHLVELLVVTQNIPKIRDVLLEFKAVAPNSPYMPEVDETLRNLMQSMPSGTGN